MLAVILPPSDEPGNARALGLGFRVYNLVFGVEALGC